jgi:hypothetical protein
VEFGNIIPVWCLWHIKMKILRFGPPSTEGYIHPFARGDDGDDGDGGGGGGEGDGGPDRGVRGCAVGYSAESACTGASVRTPAHRNHRVIAITTRNSGVVVIQSIYTDAVTQERFEKEHILPLLEDAGVAAYCIDTGRDMLVVATTSAITIFAVNAPTASSSASPSSSSSSPIIRKLVFGLGINPSLSSRVKQVAAGQDHALVLTNAGKVFSVGCGKPDI